MVSLKFYYDNLSQPCRAIEIFLRVNKIPFEENFIHLASGDHFRESFAQLNPLQKVPVISDNGFILTESVAILRYLCREKNVPDHWYPEERRSQARVDEYLEWQHTGARAPCALYFRIKVLEPMITGKQPKESRLKRLKKSMEEACDLIENVWLNDTNFIAGHSLSIADLLAITELEQLKPTGYDVKRGRPRLEAWMGRVRSMTNPYYDQVHERIEKLAKNRNLSKL